MSAFYSLIQYVPDLIRNERVNIGVVVFTEGYAETHFIENWTRVRQFGGDVSSLQTVAKEIEKMRPAALRDAVSLWQQSIQFTAPAASLLDPDTLLIDIAQRCLIDPEKHEREYRDRHQAVVITKKHLASALEAKLANPQKNSYGHITQWRVASINTSAILLSLMESRL